MTTSPRVWAQTTPEPSPVAAEPDVVVVLPEPAAGPGRDVAVSDVKDGKLAHMAPPSTIALSGNGLDTVHGEDDEDLTRGAGNGANPNPPHGV